MYIQFSPSEKNHHRLGSFNGSGENAGYLEKEEVKEAFFSSLSDGKWFYVEKGSGIRLKIRSVKRMEGANGYMEFDGEADYSKKNIYDVKVEGMISFNV